MGPRAVLEVAKNLARTGILSPDCPGLLTPGKETQCLFYTTLVGPRAGLDGAKYLARTGILSPDRPALVTRYTD